MVNLSIRLKVTALTINRRKNQSVILLVRLFLFILLPLAVGTPVTGRPPAQTRTCGFPASGSSVALAFARIFTVTRYKIQLLFPACMLTRVCPALHVRNEFPLQATCFRQVLPLAHAHTSGESVWLAFPTSEYYA
jgi:hypothetical protein